ncbi:phospholipid/glycerol acyltransferase [Rubrobacter xylanophilus DSM 9941]|uniref:Phospholipid/glycerol acyltransferase n=1 Tax=Rubrobacter xylanophilus (strain DSM 9941 / JCM 11954 / NBRC 16129 / PRD-1) TaxID=266117 RepID=Q1AW27_RUBXD|nr:lysophospholipid acyltransferase family protein [Rubrobacter xylanophilus]ABG04401.1 phospholipid/glycerol acyltransferase [Rubrobacter xylanophilus DSM 9941]
MPPGYGLLRRVVLLVAWLVWGFTIYGEEKVPKEGPLIVAANHRRFFDPLFVCMAVPRRIQWMAKKEIFLPPLRPVFRILGAFPVDRSGGGHSALRVALKHLAAGKALGIFPEGTRRRHEDLESAKSGVALLAARSGARVVPVYVGPVPSPLARLRGERFRAYIGDAITLPKDLRGRRELQLAAREVLKEIYELPRREGGDDG